MQLKSIKIKKNIFLFIDRREGDFSLGFTIGSSLEDIEHYCTRDITIHLGFYSFYIWLEETE